MKTSTSCPACGGKIKLIHVVIAKTPFQLCCPQCKTRLRVVLSGLKWLIGLIFLVFFMLGLGWFLIPKLPSYKPYLIYLGAALLTWLVIELAVGLLIFNRADLVDAAKKIRP